jgi:hypothetical protein
MLVDPGWIFAQRVSFGFVGGTNLTRDFPISRTFYLDPDIPGGLTAFDLCSDIHGFISGLSVEVDLGKGLSLEGNALRRQLRLNLRTIFPDGRVQEGIPSEIGTWEWPILLKYRMAPVRRARPFIEAGPSLRTRHNPVPSEPSQMGGTIDAGAEIQFGRLRLSPAPVTRGGNTIAAIPACQPSGIRSNSPQESATRPRFHPGMWAAGNSVSA